MFISLEVDNVTKNIINEIIRECSNHSVHLSDELVTYLVKLLSLDPLWGLSSGTFVSRDKVSKFVNKCVTILCNQCSPAFLALKMQLHFYTHMESRSEHIKIRRHHWKSQLEPLSKEIIEAVNFYCIELDNFYDKIVILITLISGVGNPAEESVFSEAKAALLSIFPKSEVEQFIKLKRRLKNSQLIEMANLVSGIRLFNRDCKRGGEGIEDLPKALNDFIDTTNFLLQQDLLAVMDRVNLLTTAIDCSYHFDDRQIESDDSEQGLDEAETGEFLEYIKDLLIVFRQDEVFISILVILPPYYGKYAHKEGFVKLSTASRNLLAATDTIQKEANALYDHLQTLLLQLHSTVRFRTAIPTAQVFPLFLEIAETWYKIQDETILLSNINVIATDLEEFMKTLNINEDKIRKIINGAEILTDAQRIEATTGMSLEHSKSSCTLLDPHSVKDYDQIPLQHLGFCVWSFVQTKGGLIPGNPNMGVIKWKNMYFAFSSVYAAKQFADNPERYVYESFEIARGKPHVIILLQLAEHLNSVKDITELFVRPAVVIVSEDVEIQTDLHPVSRQIDPTYKWNIWDLKRFAILMTNVAQCQTHSMQTLKSHFRAGVVAQTNPLKDKNLQTRTDDYSNVPTVKNFIYGLRGRTDDNPHVIELTRPVDE